LIFNKIYESFQIDKDTLKTELGVSTFPKFFRFTLMIPTRVFHDEDRSVSIYKANFHVARRKASEWYTAPPILTYIPGRLVAANFTALYPHKIRCIGYNQPQYSMSTR